MKKFKKITAVTLAATMVLGSSLTVLADEPVTSVEVEGTGAYEGGPMEFPELTVTLPTSAAADYTYIADPNDLIKDTEAKKYGDKTFDYENAKGIYFSNKAEGHTKDYTGESDAVEFTNENAQDITVTVTLAAAAGSDVTFSADSTFADSTANEMYIAIKPKTGDNLAIAADGKSVSKDFEIAGTEGNYEKDYDATNGYGYKKKAGDLTWNSDSFTIVGALNLNDGTVWAKDLEFPDITITWSLDGAAEEEVTVGSLRDATNKVDIKAGTYAANTALYVACEGTITKAEPAKFSDLKKNGTEVSCTAVKASTGDLYIKLGAQLVLAKDDVITFTVDEVEYTFVVGE